MFTIKDVICYPSARDTFRAYIRNHEHYTATGRSRDDAIAGLRRILDYYRIGYDF